MTSPDPSPSPTPPQDDPPPDPLVRLDRMRWSSVAAVLSVIALPQLVVALGAVVVTVWFVARNGVLINGQPHLYAPVPELVPEWLLWTAAATACTLLAYTWAAAVRFLALLDEGHDRPLPAALRGAVASAPAALVVFAAAAGAYLVVVAGLTWALDDPHPAWAVAVWLVLFLVLPPLWHPLAGMALGPGAAREDVEVLRKGPYLRRPTPVLYGTALAVAVVSLSVHLTDGPEDLAHIWPVAVVGLTASAILLTAASLQYRDAVLDRNPADQEGPLPGGRVLPSSGEERRRHYTGLALIAVLLLGLAAPAQLHSGLAERDPWSAPAYDRWSGAPVGYEHNEMPILFAPDGSVFLGGEEALCEPLDACEPEQDPDATGTGVRAAPDRDDGQAMTATDGKAVRTVELPPEDSGARPGSVVVQNRCLKNRPCVEDPGVLEPEDEVEGEWNAERTDESEGQTNRDWRDDTRIWAERLDGREHVVTSVPSVDHRESMLTLFVCEDGDCTDHTAVELERTDGSPMQTAFGSGAVRPKLVDFALTAEDAARVTVHEPDSGRLSLHACSDAECSDTTTTELVPASTATRTADPDPTAHAGTQVEVRDDGTPMIMHRDTRDGSVELLDCADAHCSGFEAQEVFGPGPDRPAPAMDLGPEGLPVLLGHDLASGEITLVDCADEACTESERTAVDAHEGAPGWVALRVDGQGRAVMAWARYATGQAESTVELMRCGDTSCSMLSPEDHR